MRLLIVTSVAIALLVTDPSEAAARRRISATALAKKHYERAARHYKAERYAKALAHFEKSHALSKLPALLYNIGRCHEMLGRVAEAVTYYRRYLRQTTDTSYRDVVGARLETLEASLAPPKPPEPAPEPAPRPEPVATPKPAAPPPPPGARSWSWRRTTGWTAVIAGSASLVAGVVLGALARGKQSDYEEGVQQRLTHDELGEIDSAGQTLETGQVITLVAGGVLAAAGAGLLLWDSLGSDAERPATAARLVPCPSAGGFGVAAQLRF